MMRAALLLIIAGLAGCATPGLQPYRASPMADHLQRADAVGDCARLFLAIDRQVVSADARDAQSTVVSGFPYLRIDRSGVALRPSAEQDTSWQAWRRLLADTDHQARGHELRNSAATVSPAAIDACRQLLLAADDDAHARGLLASAAHVPDDYSVAMRALGLYPLTRLAFASGVADWQRDTIATFGLPIEELPLRGQLRRFAPAADAAHDVARVLADRSAGTREAASVLGLPAPPSLAGLIERHAPLIEIDESGPYDRMGPLSIAGEGRPARLDASAGPVVYVRVAHALLAGVWRTQLVYTFWFSERPRKGVVDLLAGDLDALIWRVTLDDDGGALAYDTIHACGCYHMFFATPRVQPREGLPPGQGRLDEGLFMPQPPLREAADGERIALRIESGTHYLQRVTLRGPSDLAHGSTSPYVLRDEDELRSLPVTGAAGLTRSAYAPSGMIPGTQRLERWLFWPMGIASAGQLRQWGRQATAFVGRRHFDDPHLLERYFGVK